MVLDETQVGSGDITVRHDLPGDGSRLYADATGIDHVMCNGQVVVSHGAFTEARPGTLLRSGQHTKSPDLT